MRIIVAVVFSCLALGCFAQVSGPNPTNAASGGLTNAGQVYTTADLIALTNSLTGNTTAGLAGVLPPVQYLSPAEWAAVTNGMGPGGLAELANLSPQGGALSPAAVAAINAGLTTNDVAAIAATAAQVLATQAQNAGAVQPMTSMSGGTLVTNHMLNINFGGLINQKVGPAAVGQYANDFWTGEYFPLQYYSTINDLLWSDQTPSGIDMWITGHQAVVWVNSGAFWGSAAN
jgi:hypothetical protein